MIEPIYCFEVEFKTRLENSRIITNFAISDYWFTKELYGVNKAFMARYLVPSYSIGPSIGGLCNFSLLNCNTVTKLSFNKVLAYYNQFTKAVETNNKYYTIIERDGYIEHCKEYKYYYERLVELMQLIIAKWDDWN